MSVWARLYGPWVLLRIALSTATWGSFLVFAGVLGDQALRPTRAFLLNLAFLVVAEPVLILVHEVGHLFAGWLVGIEPAWVNVGSGVPVFTFKLLGASIRFNSVPSHGVTYSAHRTDRLMRLRQMCFSMGGPAANALLCVLLLGVARWLHPRTSIAEFFTKPMPLEAGALGNGILVAIALAPLRASAIGGLAHDGLALLMLPFWKAKTRTETLAGGYLLRVHRERTVLTKAEAIADEMATRLPDSPFVTLAKTYLHLLRGDYEEGRRCSIETLALPELPKGLEAAAANNLAWCDVILGDTSRSMEAVESAERASRIAPHEPYILGTLGSARVFADRFVDAVIPLRRALVRHVEVEARAEAAAALAVAYAELGFVRDAERMLTLARPHPCKLLPRAEQAITEARCRPVEKGRGPSIRDRGIPIGPVARFGAAFLALANLTALVLALVHQAGPVSVIAWVLFPVAAFLFGYAAVRGESPSWLGGKDRDATGASRATDREQRPP